MNKMEKILSAREALLEVLDFVYDGDFEDFMLNTEEGLEAINQITTITGSFDEAIYDLLNLVEAFEEHYTEFVKAGKGNPWKDSLTENVDVDFMFVSELRYEDYVIEFFKNIQDGKYYWQADYDGDDRRLSNFNIWITTRGISLEFLDENAYPTKANAVSKAKEWVDKQKRKWTE